ncbi:SDR family oxidoreductase [Curtobacterium sp. S6]|uniref:SDR family oxidoreductase n=1 Tax=Curtobacterium sp. S6 TaxID=1479623 RepID=UPI0004A9DD18|nr:SDR family oxidoreductase [Curtobacterium sp. S6]
MTPRPDVVIVTGGSGGIGRCVARLIEQRASDHGHAEVVSVDRVAPAREDGIKHLDLDITDQAAVDRLIEDLAASHRLRAVVNAAGVIATGAAVELSQDQIRRMIEVNALGVVNVSSAVARAMMRQGGHRPGARPERTILTIASNAGTGPRAGFAAYGASKAFASHYTRSLGLEIGPRGIRCAVVNPGTTRTPMVDALWAGADRSAEAIAGDPSLYRAGIPLGRVADPEDIAEVVEFLLSPRAAHITATELTVDGGATQR